ncbi:hypothetical protein L7F22_040158 [Adiantum nelumboides]|nr:hypothetical protein [Adiantum nelumboides]
MEETGTLLLGLPDDLPVRCLLPLPAFLLRFVNRRWRRLFVSDASFRSLRVALRAPHSTTTLFVCFPPNHHISSLTYLCFEVAVVLSEDDPPLQYQRRGEDARYLSWDDLLTEKNGCLLSAGCRSAMDKGFSEKDMYVWGLVNGCSFLADRISPQKRTVQAWMHLTEPQDVGIGDLA